MADYKQSKGHQALKKLQEDQELDIAKKSFMDSKAMSDLYDHVKGDISKLDSIKRDEVFNVLKNSYLKNSKGISKIDYSTLKAHPYQIEQHMNIDLGINLSGVSDYIVSNGSKIDISQIGNSHKQTREKSLENMIGHEIAAKSNEEREEMINTYFLPQLKSDETFNYGSAHTNPRELAPLVTRALAGDNVKDGIRPFAVKKTKKAPMKKAA